MRRIFILLGYGVILLTGAAGLVYQVTWQKYAGRLLGADSIATAVILATFLGGLSLGYYLCGKFSMGIRNHLRIFALLEGTIGLWCLAFPRIFAAIDSLTRQWSFAPPFGIIAQGFLCSTLLMGIPTVCMGGTVPLMTRGISQNLKEATNVHATIYSINTAGAVLGALLAGFYLIPAYGLPGTMTRTALVNLGASLSFLLISFWVKPRFSDNNVDAVPLNPDQGPSRFPAILLYVIAFTSGFYVMLLENVFIRFTNFSLGSSSYSFALIVAVFILAIAVGSFIVGRLQHIHASLLFWNQLMIGVSLLLIYYSLDTWPYWAHVIRTGFQANIVGFWQYYSYVFLSLTALLIIPVGCMGATIPLAFHELKRNLHAVGRHSGLLLSWNTIGNLAGSLIGGIVLYYYLNNERIFLFALLLAAVSVCLIAFHLASLYRYSGALLTLVALCFMVFAPFYDRNRFMRGTFGDRQLLPYSLNGPQSFYENYVRGPKLLFYDDDAISTIGVVEYGIEPPFNKKGLAVIINGKSDSGTTKDIYTLRLLAHIPALLAKARKEVLVIGLGTGVTAGELTLYPDVDHVDVAEISPAVIKALPYFKDFTYAVHENPKVRLIQGDAFRILGRSEKKWDLVVSEPSNPWVTGVDLLYTREFFKMVNSHLTDDGLFMQWLHQYSSSKEMLGMIYHTIQQEFPESRVFWSSIGDLLILASKKPLTSQDVKRAESVLKKNGPVRDSLGALNLNTLDAVFLREMSTPSYLRKMFSGFDLQTLDHPRLHYIAGKDFFINRDIDTSTMFNPQSVPFASEYLLALKYPDWNRHAFSAQENVALAASLRNVAGTTVVPIIEALGVKAFLGNPEMQRLPQQQLQMLGLDVLQYIVSANHEDLDWGRIGLQSATFRQKAEYLFNHVLKTRNWIVPYPLAGLEAMLQQGIAESPDPYESTWCALQLSLLLFQETKDAHPVKNVLEKVVRQGGGKIPVAESDRNLLESVNSMMKDFPTHLRVALIRQDKVMPKRSAAAAMLPARPKDAKVPMNLALALVQEGKIDEAIPKFQEALSINPNLAEAHISLGLIYAKKRDLDTSIDHFRKALQINNNIPEAHNSLGVALVYKGSLDEGIAHFEQALKINPNFAKAHNSLAVALAEKNDIEAAIVHLQKALEIKPDYEEAKKNLNIMVEKAKKK